MKSLFVAFRSMSIGAACGIVVIVSLWVARGAAPAIATDTNVYISPPWSSPTCSDWEYDTDIFPGTTHQFLYYWSGQPWWWSDSSVHHCWHNDEASSSNWRAVDYPGYEDEQVEYRATVFASNATPAQTFVSTTGCGGIDVEMWNIYGVFAGDMHYWHVYPIDDFVLGTSWANHYYVPGESLHYRTIAGVLHPGNDGCTSTGAHTHVAIYESSTAVPYRHGDLTGGYPFYFK